MCPACARVPGVPGQGELDSQGLGRDPPALAHFPPPTSFAPPPHHAGRVPPASLLPPVGGAMEMSRGINPPARGRAQRFGALRTGAQPALETPRGSRLRPLPARGPGRTMPPQELLPGYPPVPPHRPPPGRELQCVLLGDGAVGKTSLAVSYSANGYPARYVPTALDRFSAVVQVDSAPVRLHLCDTAGQDEFDTLRRLCYAKADVFLLCFSVVAPSSFQNVGEKWVPELCRLCPAAPLLLVGTQCDLRQDVQVLIQLARRREKPVAEPAARALAEKVGAVGYVECSALTQQNLKEVFDTAILAGLRHAEARGRRARSTASKVRTLSKAWWKKYVCVR